MTLIQCGTVRFENIEAVIFDKDGTLANSHHFLRNLAQKRARLIDAQIPGVQEPLLMAFGIESDRLNSAGLMAVGTRLENEIAAAAYVAETGRDWLESLSIVQSAFTEADRVFDRKADNTPLYEGAKELMQAIAQASLKIGILSSDTTANVQDFVDKYELNSLVQLAMGTDTGLSKPNPELLRQACAALDVLPERAIVIGDSAADIEMACAAKAAGCIGVMWEPINRASLKQANALVQTFATIQIVAT
ncbi:HAD family hydrolase [Leptolyngbyaceae cyanobacterium UHCC 1019]